MSDRQKAPKKRRGPILAATEFIRTRPGLALLIGVLALFAMLFAAYLTLSIMLFDKAYVSE